MRLRWILAVLGLIVLIGCGTTPVGPGGGGDDDDDNTTGSPTPSGQTPTPTGSGNPTPTPNGDGPTFDTFINLGIHDAIANGGCKGCHDFWSDGNDLGSQLNNYQKAMCCPRVQNYDDPQNTPGSLLLAHNCGTPPPTAQQEAEIYPAGDDGFTPQGAHGFSGTVCNNIYTWLAEGAGEVPPDCFGYMDCQIIQ